VVTCFGSTHTLVSGPLAAPPLVLLHGNFASSTTWYPNIADLSRSHRTYALDTIGNLGKSVATRQPTTRSEYAEWLVKVLDQLELAQVVVVGLSYGAFLALNLALCAPSRVTSLALLSPDLPLAPLTLQWLVLAAAMMLFPTRQTISRFMQNASVKGYQANDPFLEQRIIGYTNVHSLWHLRPRFAETELQRVSTRTLVLIGEKEIMHNPQRALKRIRYLLPQSEAELVPNGGHSLNRDQPQIVNARLLEFFESAQGLCRESKRA
jgi:pimeloyl-ACP methyl ester carboxylesterase